MRVTNHKFAIHLTTGIATLGLLASIGITPAFATPTLASGSSKPAASAARLAGADRIDTALQVAVHAFQGAKPSVVYVANADNAHLVDATTAGKLADGPILYAPNGAGATHLAQTLSQHPTFSAIKQVVAIGGQASVHEATLDTIAKAVKASQTGRLAGADRYATAEAIATHVLAQAKAGNPAYKNLLDKDGRLRAVYLANGSDAHLVDSMVAGTLGDGPTLLTRPDGTLSEAARQLLAQAKPVQVTGLGGAQALPEATLQAAAAAGNANASRLGGANRFATAASIAKHYTQIHGAAGEVYVAGGAATADAIIAGQLKQGPILLVNPSGETPTETASVLRDFAKNSGKNLMVYGIGGQASLPEAQLRQATQPDGANGDGKAKEKPKAGASESSGGSGSSSDSGSSGSSDGGFGGGSSSSSDSGSSSTPKESEKSPAPSNPADKPQPPADKPGAQQSDQPGDKPEKPDTEKPSIKKPGKSEGQPGDQPKPGAQQPGEPENKPGGQVPGTDESNPKQPKSQPQKPGANTPQPQPSAPSESQPQSNQPGQRVQIEVSPQKTLNAAKSESATVTVKRNGTPDLQADCNDFTKIPSQTDGGNAVVMPQVQRTAAGVFTVTTTPQTTLGKYALSCTAGSDGQDITFTVKKPHTAPAPLEPEGSPNNVGQIEISFASHTESDAVTVAKFSKTTGHWNNLKEELGNIKPAKENYEVSVSNPDDTTASIEAELGEDASSIGLFIPKDYDLIGKTFKVRLRAKESDRYLPSEWTNAITVTITK